MGTALNFGLSICVWAVRGGHGATTVAGALAEFLDATARSHDPDAFEWMWGSRERVGRPQAGMVHDMGVIAETLSPDATNLVVLRGPCSLALRDLGRRLDSIDHLVLLREPWRSLRVQDAEDALGRGVDSVVACSSRVARLIDAGLLRGRVDTLDEFSDLRLWAMKTLADPITRSVRAPMRPSVPGSGLQAAAGWDLLE